MDWQLFVFDKNNFDLIDILARKKFRDPETAREGADYCLDKLRENDWARLNKYEGRNAATAKTFFVRLVERLLIDYQRSKFGRCTAPKSIEMMGSVWIELHQKMCCHKKVESQLLHAYQQTHANIDIEGILRTIKQRDTKCLTRNTEPNIKSLSNDEDDSSHNELVDETDHDNVYFEHVLQDIHVWQNEALDENFDPQPLNKCLQGLDFDLETTILFRAVYQEGLSITKASKLVQISPKKAKAKIEKAVEEIKGCFENTWC